MRVKAGHLQQTIDNHMLFPVIYNFYINKASHCFRHLVESLDHIETTYGINDDLFFIDISVPIEKLSETCLRYKLSS